MEKFPFDRVSKWLIDHHGDAMLRLAGVKDVVEWKALANELALPSKLPDGLLEARRTGEASGSLYLIEVATYPERRVIDQLVRDAMLVFLNRRELPEMLVLVCHPRGRYVVPSSEACRSRHGWAEWNLSWKVVEIWKLDARDFLATRNPALMPWALLAQPVEPVEPFLRNCRAVIDEAASAPEASTLLVAMQIFGSLQYNKQLIQALFGGKKVMIESLLLQELLDEREAEAIRRSIETVLRARFKVVPEEVVQHLTSVIDPKWLKHLTELAACCRTLKAFQRELAKVIAS